MIRDKALCPLFTTDMKDSMLARLLWVWLVHVCVCVCVQVDDPFDSFDSFYKSFRHAGCSPPAQAEDVVENDSGEETTACSVERR